MRVRATSLAGSSDWSPTVTGTPVAQRPSAPDLPSLTPGNGDLEVWWTEPSPNGASITGYEVEYSEGNSGDWTDLNFEGTGTGTIIDSLTNGQSYQVRVQMTSSAAGSSDWSPVATGIPVAQRPSAPDLPTLTPGNDELEVEWTAPSDNGDDITGYEVEYREGNSGDWSEHEFLGTGTSPTIEGLTNGRSYQVRVRAINSVGSGQWSDSVTGTPEAVVIEWVSPATGGSISEDTDTSANRVKIADLGVIDPEDRRQPRLQRRRHDLLRGGRQQSVSEAGCEAGSRDEADLPFHRKRDRRRRARDQLRADADCNRRQRVIGGK